MAGTIPTPRSYQTILGNQIESFISRQGLKGLRIGGPLLSILETASQLDARNSQDIFNLLDSNDINRAVGSSLDRIAASEDLVRLAVIASSGNVTVMDVSFQKISTKVYAGTSAPNAGSTVINIADASSFPSSGQVYLGRGTVNYEGPIPYTSKTLVGTYWTLTLSSATQKFHDINESVILSKGGNRTIAAGTIVRTAQGNVSEAVTFTTLNSATILDGETSISGVNVVCQQPGIIGNISKNAIVEFSTQPFTGASVTNPLPFNNGRAQESDNSLRERIKAVRQSRARGTALALITNSIGVKAPDENKTVVSASTLSNEGEPAVLFIDDGTGYEPTHTGVPTETLLDEALGGEQYFKLLTGTPIVKAFALTTLTSPFCLGAGYKLSVKVAGILTEHSFSASEFRSVGNATSFEVVSAINADPNLLFSARTFNNGANIVIFARSDTNEDIEVVAPASGIDANGCLGFTAGINYTLKLYKNNQLLYKDGKQALLLSTPQTSWSPLISSGVYIKVKVDGTKASVYKITSQDFVDANTDYITVNYLNSLESWATVFNSKIPGITCNVASGRLQFISNRGASGIAYLEISEPISSDKDTDGNAVVDATNNLIQRGMFNSSVGLISSGAANDFTLNKNTGEIKLSKPLEEGDSLGAGTVYTRGSLTSDEHPTAQVVIGGSGGNLFAVVDGSATLVTTSSTTGTTFDLTAPAGSRRRYATNPSTAIFQNLKAGDWVIIWDPVFTIKGAWRVSLVDPSFTYFEIERENTHVNQIGVAPSSNGMVFIRSDSTIQQITIAAGTRSLSSLITEINSQARGFGSSIFRNKQLKLTTNTFGLDGDIFLATADIEGQKLKLPVNKLVNNNTTHIASVLSTNTENSSPYDFSQGFVSVVNTLGTQITTTSLNSSTLNLFQFLRRTVGASGGWGNHVGEWTPITAVSGSTWTLRNNMSRVIVNDRLVSMLPYGIGPQDNFAIVLDADPITKNYNIPMYRRIKPVAGQSYTATNLQVLDKDNSDNPLSTAFGASDATFFNDFYLYSRSRGKSHASSGGSAPVNYHFNKAILWRYARYGSEGQAIKIQYVNPSAPNQTIGLNNTTSSTPTLQVRLPSDAARSGLSLFDTTRFTVGVSVASPADTVTYTYSKPSVTLQRTSNVVTGTTASLHGYSSGDVVYITSGDVNFPSGPKTVVSVGGGGLTFTYNESGINSGPSAPQSVSSAPTDPNFASVVVGDIVNIAMGTSFNSLNKGTFRVTAKTATTFSVKQLTGIAVTESTPITIGSASNIQFYPIKTSASTASQIVTWINANASTIATAVAVENGGGSPGTGVIDMATVDEYIANYGNQTGGTATQSWPLFDGLNQILSCNIGSVPNTITFKNAISSDLVSNSDFDNEEFRLVPVLIHSMVKYLGSPAVGGFYAGSEILPAEHYGQLQLSSATIGSKGAIQVTGGLANAASASVNGAGAVVDTTYSKVSVLNSQSSGFTGGTLVAAQGGITQPKLVPITSASSLTTIAASGSNWEITFDGGTTLWNLRQSISDTSDKWQVDKIGNFALYTLTDGGAGNPISGTVSEGDWVKIKLANASSTNTGTFRVVRVKSDSLGFWIENPNATNETVSVTSGDSVNFYSYDSVMPGDSFVIDTDIFGTLNRGTFSVVDFGGSSNITVVSGNMQAFSSGGVLGANSAFLRVIEASPIRLIKKINTIVRTPGTTDYVDLVFDTAALASKISGSNNSSILALTKLGFSSTLVAGADAYNYATGLIGEVNKVIYGDPSNSSVYPGVVAAGARVNVSGPLVKRISVSLAIRVRSGVTFSDIQDRVKSAVASAINNVEIGKPVAISSIVSAAASVDGVVAVTVLSPTYSSGNDLISVQSNEKPRVLDIDQDVLVSVIG